MLHVASPQNVTDGNDHYRVFATRRDDRSTNFNIEEEEKKERETERNREKQIERDREREIQYT